MQPKRVHAMKTPSDGMHVSPRYTFVPSPTPVSRCSAFLPRKCRHNSLPKHEVSSRRYVSGIRASVAPAKESPLKFVLDKPSETVLQPGSRSPLPILVYVAGLESAPLPPHQRARLRPHYTIVSVCHSATDRSDWEQLVFYALPTFRTLAMNGPVTLLGESFGAAFALRLAAAAPDAISRLVLLNPGTSLSRDTLISNASRLLPIIALDRSERLLYKAAAIVLFKALLTREDRLAQECIPDEPWWLRSVDIDRAPLQAVLHRVDLLRRFPDTFTDRCMMNLIKTRTLLLASGEDRLLQSRREIVRLAGLLQNVEGWRVLEGSAHAALLEEDVNLAEILLSGSEECNLGKNGRAPVPESSNGKPMTGPSRKGGGNGNSTSRKTAKDAAYDRAFEEGRRVFEPWRQLTAPVVKGKGYVRDALRRAEDGRRRPVLFVGNHSVFGILDLSVFYIELKEILEGRRLRSLADPIHFDLFSDISSGRWERFVTDLGGVLATPRNFYRLLASGENILLFPGGAREVCRRRGENYRLFWKPDVDFIRPAAKFDAIIVPFSAVGADDCVDIIVDGQELQRLPHIGEIVRRFLDERELSRANLMPIASFPPRPDRFYFKFHEPIETRHIDPSDVDACKTLYLRAKTAVEEGMQELLNDREKDPERGLDSRIRNQVLRHGEERLRSRSFIGSFFALLLPDFDI